MGNFADKIWIGNQNTHFMFRNSFWKLCYLKNNVHKRCRQATGEYNMARALCRLDDQGYKRAHRICNTYCSATATMHEHASLLGYSHAVRMCNNLLLYHGRNGHSNAPEFHVICTFAVFPFIGKNSLQQVRLFAVNSV